jgi:UDP-2,4-diacetamido-2,4,6-trideoxy-beta-L-altropyranose hydrolase
MYRVVIRADGGSKIGLGHIMRCSVLADKLRKFAEIIFVCKSGGEYFAGIEYIKNKGFDVAEVRVENLPDVLSSIGGECLITDSYDVNEAYFEKTKEYFKFTGYIDDLNRHFFDVNFIINHNIYAKDLNYNVNAGTKLFLGTGYSLLRDEFENLPARKIKKEIKDVLVTMGGSDPDNMTMQILELLKEAAFDFNIHVIIGPSFHYKGELERIQCNKVKTYFSPPKISKIMLACDLAVSACGGTLYELAVCATPVIGIVIAENQRLGARKMEELGAIRCCRSLCDLVGMINSLKLEERETLVRNSGALVDGLGSARAAKEIYNIIKNS